MSRTSSGKKILEALFSNPIAFGAELRRYVRDVEAGADPIEALHGHVCGEHCWHQQFKKTPKGSP